MSTPQTDSHNNRQELYYQTFYAMCQDFKEGTLDYIDLEEALSELEEDDDVETRTWVRCDELFNQAVADAEDWQKIEREKWRDLERDSGLY